MSVFTKILGSVGIDKIIDSIGNSVDRFVTTDQEREELKKAINLDLQNFELELLKDKQNAREMYKDDSWLQKVYALVFLVFYLVLTGAMLWFIYSIAVNTQIELPQWGIAFISSIWGGMSSKVNTITDFLFGSSKGSRYKDLSFKNKAE